MPVELRDASPEEIAPYHRDGYETWGCSIEDDGQIVAQAFLSRSHGNVFGHNAWSSGVPMNAARLWKAIRRKCKEWGASEMWVHFDGSEPQHMIDFWTRVGFKPVMTMFRGKV